MYDYQSVRQVVAADQSFCTQYYVMALGNGNDRTPEPIMSIMVMGSSRTCFFENGKIWDQVKPV